MGKIERAWLDLAKNLKSQRDGRKVVFTNGCFDILHVGHVRYLKEARAQGDLLIVALNSDESVRLLKGPSRPLQSEDDRAEIMAALSCVDFVTIFEQETPQQLIETLRPDILVKGGDYKTDEIVGAEFVLSYGGSVRALQFVSGVSTTKIADRMKLIE